MQSIDLRTKEKLYLQGKSWCWGGRFGGESEGERRTGCRVVRVGVSNQRPRWDVEVILQSLCNYRAACLGLACGVWSVTAACCELGVTCWSHALTRLQLNVFQAKIVTTWVCVDTVWHPFKILSVVKVGVHHALGITTMKVFWNLPPGKIKRCNLTLRNVPIWFKGMFIVAATWSSCGSGYLLEVFNFIY